MPISINPKKGNGFLAGITTGIGVAEGEAISPKTSGVEMGSSVEVGTGGVGLREGLGEALGTGVGTLVGTGVGVFVGVGVLVAVGVFEGLGVSVIVGVIVGSGVFVTVGVGATIVTDVSEDGVTEPPAVYLMILN